MTTDTAVQSSLPLGVGQLTPRWKLFLIVVAALFGFGIYAYVYQLSSGLGVTNLRNTGTMGGATWGLYIVMVEYFIGVSFAGVVVAAVSRVFRIRALRPITRVAELLTVVSLLAGVLAVVVDLGHPIRGIVNMLRYGRPQSPFFGTFTLVAVGVLLISIAYLYLGGRQDAAVLAAKPSRLQRFHKAWAGSFSGTDAEQERLRRALLWLSLGIIPIVVIALSTEGLVFGLQVGRPGWFGSLQGPDFIVLAAVSGLANLVVLGAIVRRVIPGGEEIGPAVFRWLGSFLLVAVSAALYFAVVEAFTLLYATPAAERDLADELLGGSYAWVFWASHVGMLVAFALLVTTAARRRWSMALVVPAALIASTSALAERFHTVIPSQTHGMLLPYQDGSYFPNWVEFAVVGGLFALGALLIGVFAKAFPLLPLAEEKEVPADA